MFAVTLLHDDTADGHVDAMYVHFLAFVVDGYGGHFITVLEQVDPLRARFDGGYLRNAERPQICVSQCWLGRHLVSLRSRHQIIRVVHGNEGGLVTGLRIGLLVAGSGVGALLGCAAIDGSGDKAVLVRQ